MELNLSLFCQVFPWIKFNLIGLSLSYFPYPTDKLHQLQVDFLEQTFQSASVVKIKFRKVVGLLFPSFLSLSTLSYSCARTRFVIDGSIWWHILIRGCEKCPQFYFTCQTYSLSGINTIIMIIQAILRGELGLTMKTRMKKNLSGMRMG